MGVKVSNNAFGTISAGINSSATTVTLDSGQGARFPTLGGSDHFYGTLIDTSNNVEIIKVTARSTDSMTVVRAQDNTTAQAFAIGDRFELRPVAKLFEDILSEAVPAADTIVNSMIATDAVNADSIAANAVGASELNVSGNGTSGQVLSSDADGTFSWATVSADKPTYNRAQLNGTPSFTGSGTTWQDAGLSVTITPQYTNSRILVMGRFVMRSDSTGADGNGRILRQIGGGGYNHINPNTSPYDSNMTEQAFAGNIRGEATNHGYGNLWFSLDHPNTTSTCTYKLQVIGESNFNLNRGTQVNNTRFGAVPAEIVVLEVLT